MLLYAEAISWFLRFGGRSWILNLGSKLGLTCTFLKHPTKRRRSLSYSLISRLALTTEFKFPPSQAYRRIKFDRCTINRLLSKILSSQPKEAVNDLDWLRKLLQVRREHLISFDPSKVRKFSGVIVLKWFPSTLKRKAGVFKFLRVEECFRKAPFSWRITWTVALNVKAKLCFQIRRRTRRVDASSQFPIIERQLMHRKSKLRKRYQMVNATYCAF